jgi:inosine-uridine nucleoside N-ribohydrolase
MRRFLLFTILVAGLTSFIEKPVPVSIIFDTDIGPDYDDVGALAMLHAFADKGEAKILATISCNVFKTTAPTLSAINTYFGRPNLPIGITKAAKPYHPCDRLYAEHIIANYPHSVQSNDEVMDAVKLYRKMLSSQPDKSVTIVTVGFFTNLGNLLDSSPDEFSSLNGQQLVRKKVKQLVSMAGGLDSLGNNGYEFNVMQDITASKKVFDNWPTPITLTGLEIGKKIFTGIPLINNDKIENSPVKDAYRISLAYDKNNKGRYSWDQTAVLIAVKGIKPYFKYRSLNFTIQDDGKNALIPGNKIRYIQFKQTPEQISKVIEDLMMHQPRK